MVWAVTYILALMSLMGPVDHLIWSPQEYNGKRSVAMAQCFGAKTLSHVQFWLLADP